ncbi:MAG: LuxR C-terminal-related transcriptional regulator [bacterium]
MTHESERLDEARAAYEIRDWEVARDGFIAASRTEPLPAGDRYALARCWWWIGDLEACSANLEDAHVRALEEGRTELAATAALELGLAHLLRGNEPVGSGWIGRAGRLAAELPEAAIHGYLALVLEVDPDFSGAEPTGTRDAARRVRDIGRRCGDPTLVAAGLHGEGRALIGAGDVSAGMALLDEAMVAVLAGEVDGTWAGNLYCATIGACHDLGDFRRMAQWTEAMQRWLDELPAAALFAGDCRVHRAQLLILRGEWDRAAREAERACEELETVSVMNAAEAWYEVGEVRRRRGDLQAAEDAYRTAHGLGRDPEPGFALLRLAQGRVEAASTSIGAAMLTGTTDSVGRARLCAAQVEIALAAGRLEVARRACGELHEIAAACASPGLEAMAGAARGAVLLAAGRPEQALAPLRKACRLWRELDVPDEAARTGVLLARTYSGLDDTEAARRELDAAASMFDRLGAYAEAARRAVRHGSQPRPYGLSDRELEVLRLVADGRNNPQVAEALVISRRTVARHMSNIFVKLGVSSRTEAARFALDHGLLPERWH